MARTLSFVPTSQVSELLGVSEQTVRTWCRLGVIPAARPPGTRKWLIHEDDFRDWLAAGGGQRLVDFLDDSTRSTATDEELLEDANAVLSRRSERRASASR